MEFKLLCELFDSIRKTTGPYEKSKICQDYFTKCRQNHPKENLFSIIRLIVPKLDRERDSYHMKESKIARVIIKMLALPPGNDKNILTKSYLMSGQASDFGDVVYSVIRKYLTKSKTVLKIHELNNFLDDMSKRSNETEAEDILMKLFKKCSAEDSRWIIRIILKDLKLGIDNNRILNCYHRDGANYFASNNSLRKVCEIFYDQNINLHELEIEIFEAFRPMLSKRVDAAVFKKHFIENKLFYVENKFDGERFQLHMQNGTYKYFSRRGFDFTETFGSTIDDGIFTPKLKDTFQPFVKKIILDGEMMLWNKQTKKYGSKGMELDVKKLKENGRYQPCFCVYDIILLNGNILTNKPLKDRMNILRHVLKSNITGTIVLSEIKETHTQQEIVNELNWAVDNEEEGIIVKDPESIYKYSDRNSGWYKMKLEYFQDTMNDLDLILMGGQYASSTSDQLNSFIIGVRSGQTDDGKPIYLSFGKVSSGLNDDELDMLNRKLKSEGHIFANRNHSACLVFGKEVPNYFIEPEHSLVLVVRATELTRTTDFYKTSYTLRFPRVLNIRTDKPVEDCLSMNELLELTNKNKAVIKLNKKNIDLEEILQTKTKRIKKKVVEVVKFADSRKISDLLEGYTFHVLSGTKEKSKDEIEALIKKAGGNIFYKIDNTVDIVLVGIFNDKAKEFSSKRRHYDVINLSWLYRTIQDGELLAYETEEIYCIGTNIKNCLSEEVDRYGDSYTKDATIKSLKHSFQIIENLKEQPCFRPMIEIPRKKSFEKYVAYFDKYDIVNHTESNIIYNSLADELEFRYYYGKVCQKICDETNLVIIKNNDREKNIKQYLESVAKVNVEIKNNFFIYK